MSKNIKDDINKCRFTDNRRYAIRPYVLMNCIVFKNSKSMLPI